MTDRHIAYVVTLDHAVRADVSQHLIDLISRLNGVVSVEPVVQNGATEAAYQRALAEIRGQVAEVLWPTKK
jgi:hypothetical protein